MELTQADYERIAHCFPKHRGTVTYGNLQVLNAILYIAENGAKWRRLPEIYGHWHTVRSAMISANSFLRQAASLFGKRILPLVAEKIDVPIPVPFAGATAFKAPTMRYQSRIDPEIILARAVAELDAEPLKIITTRPE